MRLSILLPLVLTTGLASAFSQKDPKVLFQTQYDKLTRAYLAKDLRALGALIAPDYKGGSYSREVNRAKFLDECAKSRGIFTTKSRKVLGAIVNKDKANVFVRSFTFGKLADRKTGMVHSFEIELLCTDTWVKNSKGWQMKHMKVVHTKTTADGKPFRGRVIS